MSKRFRPYYSVFATIFAILQFFTFAEAQSGDVRIAVTLDAGPKVRVTGNFAPGRERKNLSFIGFAAGVSGLGARISEVELRSGDGRKIAFRRLQDGEYLAEADISGWSYTVNLAPPQNDAALAHISWVGERHGLLMLDDLLPIERRERAAAKIRIELPEGWEAASADPQLPGGGFAAEDPTDSVIAIGSAFEQVSVSPAKGQMPAGVTTVGKWHFTASEASAMTAQILAEYARAFRGSPAGAPRVLIVPFPTGRQHGAWQAETRDRTVTIVSSDMAFRTQSLQRLHEQLRHELFHLWLPNGVSLSGRYDWFYEGFAVYWSLRTAVAVNRISFADMLSTLSRAYAIDKRQTARQPMIAASGSRWANGSTELYARGMLIAFMTDVAILQASRGRNGAEAVFAEVFAQHPRSRQPVDGNEAVTAIMGLRPELRPILERYVKGAETIDPGSALAAAGLELETESGAFTPMQKPGSRQKAILDRLGYNNWRNSPKYQQ